MTKRPCIKLQDCRISEYQAIQILMFTVKYKFTKRKEKYNNEPKSQASVIVHFLKIVFIDGF